MRTVFSLLFLQSKKQKDPVCGGLLMDAAGRVQSMMVLYDKLYRSVDTRSLSIRDFLTSLIGEIIMLFHSEFADNGIGMPESVSYENSGTFGLELSRMPAVQINAGVRMERKNGTRYYIEFEII